MQLLHNYIESTTVNDRIDLESNIESLEAQLVELRNRLSGNEQRHQNQLTMLGAAGSAIEQVINFVKLCMGGKEDGMVDTFWDEIMLVKAGKYKEHRVPLLISNKDYEKMKISELKKMASNLGLTEDDVKEFGSPRNKKSWIEAIKTHNEQAIKDASQIVTDGDDSDNQTALEATVLEVESEVVESETEPESESESEPEVENQEQASDTITGFNSSSQVETNSFPTEKVVEDDDIWTNELTEHDPDDDNWGVEPETNNDTEPEGKPESSNGLGSDSLEAPSWRDSILAVEDDGYVYGEKVVYSVSGDEYKGVYQGTKHNGIEVGQNEAVVALDGDTEVSVINLDSLRPA